jgi:hypothetical protein
MKRQYRPAHNEHDDESASDNDKSNDRRRSRDVHRRAHSPRTPPVARRGGDSYERAPPRRHRDERDEHRRRSSPDAATRRDRNGSGGDHMRKRRHDDDERATSRSTQRSIESKGATATKHSRSAMAHSRSPVHPSDDEENTVKRLQKMKQKGMFMFDFVLIITLFSSIKAICD